MLTSQRKKLILEKLAAEGQVQSRALSEWFNVSEDTIRRDLRELSAEGVCNACMAARYRPRRRWWISRAAASCRSTPNGRWPARRGPD